MNKDEILEDLGFVKRAKNREKVLKVLFKPQNPSSIGRITKIGLNMSSRALRELEDRKLIKCANPKQKVGRIYTLTKKGEILLEYFKEKD
ncbi:MAG: MarR family transcriptional regulator [Candidatus Aenigmarchaeota archaeon]|nr:MarR family transcriptional regulator [Candidatus Aenigmarchaeota archaeon]